MIPTRWEPRIVEATVHDAEAALLEFDQARAWLRSALAAPMEPLAAEVWVFDPGLKRVVLVRHRWRAWVPPGGKVEPGETPREGAVRELRGGNRRRSSTLSATGVRWRSEPVDRTITACAGARS